MNKKYKIFILLTTCIYVIYHLATLSYSPLPWFDEVSFASITNSYIKNRTFYPEAINISVHGQNSMYGPLFFALQAWIIKLTGWSMFGFRISNLLFGLADLYLVYRICLHLKFRTTAVYTTVAILAFDRSYNQFLHSGRMDFMTIFFFLLSYLVFEKIQDYKTPKWPWLSALTGLLLAAAVLTTPRIIFAVSFYCCYFFYDVYMHRQDALRNTLVKYAIILITFCGAFYAWVYTEFGDLHNYIYVNYTSNEIIKAHVGAAAEAVKFNSGMLYFAYALFSFLLLLATKQAAKNIKLILLTLPVTLSFLLLVGGALSGRYYAMVAPFTTLLFVGATMQQKKNVFPVLNYAIAGLLVVLFLVKGSYVFATLKDRDPAFNEQRIMQYIPAGASIGGDFEYYYFARRKNCYFQSLGENGIPNAVFNYYRNADYDYFIFNKHNREIDNYKTWVFRDRYKLIATIDDTQKQNWLSALINRLGYRVTESYSCYIYKNISRNAAQPSISPAQ